MGSQGDQTITQMMPVKSHNKELMKEFIEDMEALRQELPEPFFIKERIGEFYNSPVAKKMIAEGPVAIDNILEYLGAKPRPELVAPAVMLLSYFDPQQFYDGLLDILKDADRLVVEAFESGFWLIRLDEEKLAADLITLANENANVLLLLQRPVVKVFKKELQKFIESKKMPLSLFAMYCYKYTLGRGDVFFLEKISGWKNRPEIAAEAGVCLHMLNTSSYDE